MAIVVTTVVEIECGNLSMMMMWDTVAHVFSCNFNDGCNEDTINFQSWRMLYRLSKWDRPKWLQSLCERMAVYSSICGSCNRWQ
jgi:hypothetical protein